MLRSDNAISWTGRTIGLTGTVTSVLRTARYKPPIHMIMLTAERETSSKIGAILMTTDNPYFFRPKELKPNEANNVGHG